MNIAGQTVLVTGANRGIGRALVEEALNRGARRVYAAARRPLTHPDDRVRPVTFDVTDRAQIRKAAEDVDALDILVNNAGVARYDDLTDRAMLDEHLAVNFFGTYDVVQAFLPQLIRSGGAIVNNLSINALAPLPLIPAYSVSKAAAFSLTQSLRVLLVRHGVRVHAVLTGPVDTEMNAGFDIPKAAPAAAAGAVFDGVERDCEEIFPDPMSQSLAPGWPHGAIKTLQRQYAALLDPQPTA